jgi:6-phospho-beta-glucosidase
MSGSSETVSFPKSFAFGASTSAYQIEGGWLEGRRGLTIWDAFSQTPCRIKDGKNGHVAADHYHRFRSDVKLMGQMSLKYYRFSISWARIMPAGNGNVNEEGVRFYSELINELIRQGIHPVVTLFHWDLPLPLQIEKNGWLSSATATAFVQYADVCFSRFGGASQDPTRALQWPDCCHPTARRDPMEGPAMILCAEW